MLKILTVSQLNTYLRELNPHYIRSVTPPRTPSVVRLPTGLGALVEARYAELPENDRVHYVEHVDDVLALWAKAKDSVDHPAHVGGYLSVVLVYRLLPHKLKAKARFGLLLNVLTVLFALVLWYVRTP